MPITSAFWLLPTPTEVLLLMVTLSLLELRNTKPGGGMFRLICGMKLTMNGWCSASLADIRSRGFVFSSAVIMVLASSLSFDHTDGFTFRSA